MKPEEFLELKHTIHGRIMIELQTRYELLQPRPIGIIMRPDIYQTLMTEMVSSYVGLPPMKIYDLQILIYKDLNKDLAFIYDGEYDK